MVARTFRRRLIAAGTVLAALAAAAAGVPPPALAARVIGLVMPQCCDFGDATRDAFAAQLQAAGVAAGEVEIIVQRPGPDKVSLINSIRKVLAYDASIVVVFGSAAAREAARETGKVPVVFIGSYDPVKAGLAQELERPGRNITGVTCRTSLPFLLDAMSETVPLRNLGVIHHSDNLDSVAQLDELKDLVGKRGISLTTADLKKTPSAETPPLMAGSQFVYLAAGCYGDFIGPGDLARLGKPVATQCPAVDPNAVVYSLSADGDELLTEAARTVQRILKGEKPGAVPVAGIKRISFTINLPAAQATGVKIPFGVLGKATRVVK